MATKIEPASPQAARQVSYQEFLTSLDDNTWGEWVRGEVVPMSPITHEHQQLSAFLIALLQFFVETRRLGLVLFEPFQMKTGPDLPGRSPDILFLVRRQPEPASSDVSRGTGGRGGGDHQLREPGPGSG